MQASATPAPDQNVPSLSVEAQKKVQKGLDYKKQGNEAFLAHDYQRALHAYHHAVLSPLTGIQPKAETIPTESTSIRQDHQELSQAMVRNGDIYAAHSFLMSEDAKPYRSEPSYEEEKASIEKQIEERERQSNRSMRGFLGKRST